MLLVGVNIDGKLLSAGCQTDLICNFNTATMCLSLPQLHFLTNYHIPNGEPPIIGMPPP
jgi:hypothetical protein